ncbi:enoyl-ACP reductase FabI [Stratiformator vulcanicus]|uniref:Enoyl-[acyl-carrier-protein] reductase [NADH] n=1 Tax=Stratiformator vulcanicus TaxID=2527980 RepID=A0A517QVK0_9PLAN|nr:enoyl-ACP reductase [Stratiformator vulcanicus]QDT35672.1 Enoyl-[acyl-carrier-protein] reductase [NADH] FabI [Stratiformator vulcanicus]
MVSMEGKTGLVFGIANDRSIAAAIASECHAAGAKMGFTHLPDTDPERPKAAKRLHKVVDGWDPALVMPCDATNDEHLDAVFAEAEKTFGKLDFVIHSIAYAPIDDLTCPVYDVSRDGFKMSMEISAYSLISLTNRAKPLMKDGGSILAMTYLGGETVIPGYNLMGVCKAALESTMTYLAAELGPSNIRVNAVSAGPLRTLAASAVGDFQQMQKLYETFSPLRRNITFEEVGKAGAFLLSDAASGISGENLHVDAGYHVMGAPPMDVAELS